MPDAPGRARAATAALVLAGSVAGCGADDPGAATASGSALYAEHCAICHGADGEGGTGPALDATGSTALDRDGIVQLITDGSRSMPAFATRMSAAEIGLLADHVATWYTR